MNLRVFGQVVDGQKLGRKIGFPTANIKLCHQTAIESGVYAVRVNLDGREYCGVANIGVRPTVETTSNKTLEVNIFDFEGDIYSQTVEVEFVAKLRDERKFDSIEELKNQIKQDVQNAKIHLKLI